ncbi:MAG: ABC transporter ATP-binding protein [Gammaproteobacteria bacterium]|nr:ABC transporter ATP-binding protein [Gammaproteobacteria bacterium]
MTKEICLTNVSKQYPLGDEFTTVLNSVDFEIEKGEYIALMGPSGSGKSTLLNIIAGIDRPSSGKANIAGVELGSMNESALAKFRGKNIGIVFQFFQLIPTLTVLENILLALDYVTTIAANKRHEHAMSLLEKVGMAGHAKKLPSKLSGGEQQRVAIARALANNPQIIVADEPTGNLDSKNSELISSILGQLTAEGCSVIVATHEIENADRYSRRITLKDGNIISDSRRDSNV